MGTRFTIFLIIAFVSGLTSCQNKQKHSSTPINNSIDSVNYLIKRNKKDASLYAKRANIQAEQGNTEQAIKDLTIANKLDSLNADYYLTLSDFYIQLGNSETTRKILERANRNIKNNAAILYRLGNLYFYIQNYQQALKYLNQSIKTDPYFSMAYFSRGLLLLEQADTNNAITNFQIAVEREPEYYEAYLQLGLLFMQKNNALAISYYDNAIALHPKSYEANYGKAMTFQKLNLPEQAIATYQHMLSEDIGKKEQLYFNIAYNYMNHKLDYSLAIPYYDTAIIYQKYFTEAYCNRAYCHEQLNKPQKALTDFNKALEINPNYPIALKGLQRINAN